jgi:hypothetical protein
MDPRDAPKRVFRVWTWTAVAILFVLIATLLFLMTHT